MGYEILSDEEYERRMLDLGFTFDEDLGKFFKGESAFFGNVSNDVSQISDVLFETNSFGHLTYGAAALQRYVTEGAEFVLGDGGIDEYGEQQPKGIYCTNYKELYHCKESHQHK